MAGHFDVAARGDQTEVEVNQWDLKVGRAKGDQIDSYYGWRLFSAVQKFDTLGCGRFSPEQHSCQNQSRTPYTAHIVSQFHSRHIL
jgi:hypothetical protein